MPIPPWTTITLGQLATRISSKEIDTYRDAFTEPGSEDPIQVTIDLVAERVRGSVGANSDNILGPDGTVPSPLMDCALDLIVWRMMSRAMGQIQDPNGARKAAADRAEELLAKVERGDGPVIPEPATDGKTIGPDGLLIVYSAQIDTNSREDQDGI